MFDICVKDSVECYRNNGSDDVLQVGVVFSILFTACFAYDTQFKWGEKQKREDEVKIKPTFVTKNASWLCQPPSQ